MKGEHHVKVFVQIFLLVSMSFAFSYLVSAQDEITEEVVSTCVETTDGKYCQEILTDDCDTQCSGACIPSTMEETEECQLGTCYDPATGICSINSPKKNCVDNGGTWNGDPFGNIQECRKGCCLVGDQASFVTERECDRIGEFGGIITYFKPEINSISECALEERAQAEGACVYIKDDRSVVCTLDTKQKCLDEGKDFYEGFLCSHPDIESSCEKQTTTNCVEGRDEVYWFDSCGNRENIYEGSNSAQKESSWNEGKLKPKEDSCDIGNSFNPVANRGDCGNCDSIYSSTTCGLKNSEERLDDSSQDVVCRDLSCWDEENQVMRKNFESWCYYQGSVLPKEGAKDLDRATATPGSRHFTKYCYEGEIYTYSCGDQRERICTESSILRDDGSNFSLANCRNNYATTCIFYNMEEDTDLAMELCEENPDCFVKKVRVSDAKFDFDMCAPKYPLGIDFNSIDSFNNGEQTCSIASLECDSAKIKKWCGLHTCWKWQNKGCRKLGFTKQMNDLCMSLSDCGAGVNYIGAYSDDGYTISGAPTIKEDSAYVNILKTYANLIAGEKIFSSSFEDILEAIGNPADIEFDTGAFEGFTGYSNPDLLSGAAYSSFGFFIKGKIGSLTFFQGLGRVFGAAIIGYWLGSAFVNAFGEGFDVGLANTLITMATISAAFISVSSTTVLSGLYWTGVVGLIIVAAVVVISWLAGIGDVKEYTTTFTCMPWSPPTGGDYCDRCYDDGLGCSEYACESLGSTCEFVNEGTSFEGCIPLEDDGIPPIINPYENALSEGYEYANITDNGFTIVSTETDDGCVHAFSPIIMGLSLDEPGRCTFTVEEGVYDSEDLQGWLEEGIDYDPEDFGLSDEFLGGIEGDDSLQDTTEDEFIPYEGSEEFYFGGNNVFMYNHTHSLYFPTLASLHVSGFDPERRRDFDLKIRCEDKHGNKNPVDYIIRTCIQPEIDYVAPTILDSDPIDGLFHSDTTSLNFSIYVNEPANCRWALEDKDYMDMEREFNCYNDPTNGITTRAGGSFKCDSYIWTNKDEETIYARCQDQPWLPPERKEDRNTMDEGYELSMKRTGPLKIEDIYPEDGDVLIFGTEPATVNVSLITSGGGYNGDAFCEYLLIGNVFAPFRYTGDNLHKDSFNQFDEGEKKILIRCEDRVGNVAYANSSFEIEMDTTAPEVARVYRKGGQLKIITNEESICYYDHNSCNFDEEEADQISIGRSKVHSLLWDTSETYYIKCLDKWSNWESGCSIIIKPEELI